MKRTLRWSCSGANFDVDTEVVKTPDEATRDSRLIVTDEVVRSQIAIREKVLALCP
jgi:hypothetical protein